MPYLALIFIITCFLKSLYYGIYEIKEKQNIPGGIAVFIISFMRFNNSRYRNFTILLCVKSMI